MNIAFDPKFSGIDREEILREIGARRSILERARRGEIWNERWLGWFSVRETASARALAAVRGEAARVQERASAMIVIGIGGSNRGAMAAIQALRGKLSSPTRIVWAGDTLSGSSLRDALEVVERESVVLNVIAKDFKTLEPGITFRILRQALMDKYGAGYAERVIATGSHGDGQLFDLARAHGWRFLEFPENIGGRFSVLSNVGLFPMAVAGVDIESLVAGAEDAERSLKSTALEINPAAHYAANRNLLFERGFGVESLVFFEPDLLPLARWWTQLFAETEGKTPSAVFPTYFSYSEDLHAVGQYVQEGRRCIAETYLRAFRTTPDLRIEPSIEVADRFDYLDGKAFDELNRVVYEAAIRAHSSGGVPCQEIVLPEISEFELGALFYFFMFSCYLSASILGVNPFTQNGVESYKRAMQALLRKERPVSNANEGGISPQLKAQT